MTKATFLVTFKGYLAVLCTLVVVTSAQAQRTVNLNFGFAGQSPTQEYTGLGVAPDAGVNTLWNLADETMLTQSNLTASDNTPTGIGFSLTGQDNDAPYSTEPAGTGISLYQLGFINNTNGGQGTLTINGLDDSRTYDFYAYSQVNNTNPAIDLRGGTFTIGGTTHTATATTAPPAGNHSTFVEGLNYVKFSNVTPTSGEITVTIDNTMPQGGNNGWVLNGFQIQDLFADITEFEWAKSGVGDWNIAGHWDPSRVANSAEHTAVFGSPVSITGPTTAVTHAAVTVNRMEFDNATHPYQIAGSGSVNLAQNPTGSIDPTIDVLNGSHEFQVEVNLDANTTVTAGDDTTLTFHNIINLGANDLTLEPATGGLENGIVELNTSISGTGTVTNTATLATGLGASLGNLNFDSSGALDFDITPNSAGQLIVGGTATLDGSVNVDFLDGATPTGDVTLLTSSSPIVLPNGLPSLSVTGASGLSLALSGDSMSLLLSSGSNPVDADGSGFIDGDDFLILQRTNPSLIPDWNTQYGQAALAASASATAVPEPTALALTLVSLCGLAMLRGRSYQG